MTNPEDEVFTPNSIPVLPLRDMVPMPQITFPVSVGRESSIRLTREASAISEIIFIVTQKDPQTETPGKRDLYSVGVVARVVKVLDLPDGSTTSIVQTLNRGKLLKIKKKDPYLRGEIEALPEIVPDPSDKEMHVLIESIDDSYAKILDQIGENETRELRFTIRNMQNPLHKINFICANSPIDTKTKQHLLEFSDLKERTLALVKELETAWKLMQIKAEIQSKTSMDLSRQQREHFLQAQIRTIQDELGGSVEDQEIDELLTKAKKMKWPEDVDRHFHKEIQKLERYNASNPEYSVLFTYLETLLALPWNNYSDGEVNIAKVEEVLERDHYGLKEVKERIIEQIAVMKLRGDMKSPILCLYGPPGVGKTSLGKSIAEAIGREYARISLGGLHDESEIRGHRKTYIGAMPGRIISAMKKCGTSNPVFVLDEIDKIGNDYKGDPSTALLEVLDPEQNDKFHDNYVDIDYDLSKVLFIATANDLSTVSRPLLDRMELIEINGYISDEKEEIALRHLIPKVLREHGLEESSIEFSRDSLRYIIERYTREAGVRSLEKKLAKVIRKLAVLKAKGEKVPARLGKEDIIRFLGPEEVSTDEYEGNDYTGVVTGLAWTQAGGEILFIEASLSEGKGEKLTLTGNLGDVMKESAIIALDYIKAHAQELDIDMNVLQSRDIHIHVPEGAVPKDGPSAGITMLTALCSAFTDRKVKAKLAMTGEMTLRGKVLPVGGIKEKILAAKRAGITDIILSGENRKDIEKIDPEYLKGLSFHYVERAMEVLQLALLPKKENK